MEGSYGIDYGEEASKKHMIGEEEPLSRDREVIKNYVYLLRCVDDSLYCGWTTDVKQRIKAHNEGNGAKYTKSRRPVELVYYETYEDRHEALSREWHIKRLSRKEKLELIEKRNR